MVRIGALGLVLSAAALACGCAGAPVAAPPSLISDPPLTNDASGFGYQLSEEEKGYDCKKLTGKMQIRILQIRGYETRKQASAAARTTQAVATPIFGGTKEGLDPDGQYRKDRAMLEAYNHQLAAKSCKTFDLDAELQRSDGTPEPKPKPKP